MTYQPSFDAQPAYGGPQPSYGYQQPPKRRGLKRTIFGGIGVVLNFIGLFVMPIIAGLIGGIIAGIGAMDLTEMDARGGTIESSGMSAYWISVPASEAGSVTCEFSGNEITPEPMDHSSVGSLGGVEYVTVYQVTGIGDGDIVVECDGASALAYSEVGVTGVLVSLVIGLAIPVLLGLASLILLIWGIVALVRSRPRY